MFFKKDRNTEELDFLPIETASSVEGTSYKSRMILFAIALFSFCAIVWASFAEVQEVVRGFGKIIPSRHVQVIQSLEGGIVAEIPVKAGDIVDAGQLLIRIDNKRFVSSLGENTVSLGRMKAKAVRLYAESYGANFDEALRKLNFKDIPSDALQEERSLFGKNAAYTSNDASIIREQINQVHIRNKELQERIANLNSALTLTKKEIAMTEPLIYSGAASQVDLLKLKKEANSTQSEIDSARTRIQENNANIAEYSRKLAEVSMNSRSTAQKDFNDIMTEIGKTRETITGVKDQVDRSKITSPVRGVVKQIFTNTIGGVITPGMDIMEVVPLEDKLVVEAKIKPSDIAFIKEGDRALIKLTAYDYSIYGGLHATVTHISPDTTVQEKEVFYSVQLTTDKNSIEKNGKTHRIIPGMVVQTDIITGKKTVMQYILKPIIKTKQSALTER